MRGPSAGSDTATRQTSATPRPRARSARSPSAAASTPRARRPPPSTTPDQSPRTRARLHSRPHQRPELRGVGDHHQLDHPAHQRDRGRHRRLLGRLDRPHLPAERELLQRGQSHRQLHLHAERRLGRDRFDDGHLRGRHAGRRQRLRDRDRGRSATAVPVLTNDTDIDGGPKTIASIVQPTNGTVVGTGGSSGAWTGLTYQPNANYCNNPPGTTPDTFTYTLNGGSHGHRLDDGHLRRRQPGRGQRLGDRDRGCRGHRGPVLTNDTDVDGGTKAIASITQPANGTVVGTGGPRRLDRSDLPAERQLLQQPAGDHPRHLHLHPQRRLAPPPSR